MENLQYKDDKLCILDQRLLPNEEKWIEIKNKEQAFDAIKDLAVRGVEIFFKRIYIIIFRKKRH